MDKGAAVLLTAFAGAVIALQPPVNAGLARATGSLGAAFVSFAIGTIVLAALVALSGNADRLSESFSVEAVYLTGGVLGVVYVTAALITVSSIGAGGVAAATITGQLTASVLLDRLGVLGLEEQPITAQRLIGIALLLVGTYLVVR